MGKSKWLIWIFVLIMLSGCSLPFINKSNDVEKSDPLTKNSTDLSQSSSTGAGVSSNEETSGIIPGKNAADLAKSTQGSIANNNQQGVKSEQTVANTSYLLVTLFYQDAGKSIIPVTRRIEKQDAIARTAVNGLIDDPINREEIEYYGVYPVLPKDTKVLGIDIKDGIAIIDFNSNLLNYKDEISERNIVSSIVYTLTEFKSINGVRINIEGRSQSFKYGTDITGILNRENVLINTSKANLTKGLQKADIYLFKQASTNYSHITPVSVQFEQVKKEELPSMIVEMLLKDYSARKMFSQLPKKTKLLGSEIKGNELTLNFNNEIRNYGGNAREDGLIRQLLYSMKQIRGIEKIRILVEGKDTLLPEGSEVSKGLSIPNTINDFIDDYSK
ncbi:MAG: hypothetical protein K0R31_1936 [Clostridiales bacterium]|nr:hypothetical protein [Clostridiales bacterium]